MSKVYVRQIEPEYQESPLFLFECFPDNIVVTGNRDYNSHTTPLYDRVRDTLDNGELAEALDDMRNGGYYSSFYKNATEAVNDLLPPEKCKYSTRDIHALKGLLRAYAEAGIREENNIICKVLSLVSGSPWGWAIIRGCCQGEWQEVFYPVNEWNREALAAFEVQYFNEGSEWIIHAEPEEPEGPEDISGYSCYTVSMLEDDIRKELAEIAGCAPADLVIYAVDGYTRSPIYKAV